MSTVLAGAPGVRPDEEAKMPYQLLSREDLTHVDSGVQRLQRAMNIDQKALMRAVRELAEGGVPPRLEESANSVLVELLPAAKEWQRLKDGLRASLNDLKKVYQSVKAWMKGAEMKDERIIGDLAFSHQDSLDELIDARMRLTEGGCQYHDSDNIR